MLSTHMIGTMQLIMVNKKSKHRIIFKVPFSGLFKHRQADQANSLLSLHLAYGRFIKLPIGGRLMVADPEIVQHVLLTNMDNYSKDLSDYRLLTYLVGSGLLTSEGKRWRAQRHVMQSLFHLREMPNYFALSVKAIDRFCEHWQANIHVDAPVDIALDMMTLSLMMTAECLLKTSLSVDVAKQVVQAFFYQHTHIFKTGNLFSWVPLPKNIRYQRAKRFTDKMIYKIYQECCRGNQHDVVSVMKNSVNESTSQPFSKEDILDQVKTMLATGHETTGLGLAWTWYLLAKNLSPQQALLDEIEQELPSGFDYDGLEKFKYTQMVFQETIRLYPPIWAIPRCVKADDEIAGYKIPARSKLLINIFSLHRLANEWQDPDTFNPERFSKEHRDKRHKYAYLPFGAGPHVCIANGLALMQAKMAIVLLSRRFKLSLVDPNLEPGIKTYVSLKPDKPILMRVGKR